MSHDACCFVCVPQLQKFNNDLWSVGVVFAKLHGHVYVLNLAAISPAQCLLLTPPPKRASNSSWQFRDTSSKGVLKRLQSLLSSSFHGS